MTAHVKLKRVAAIPESRAVQARLMMGLALVACGGVLVMLLLMGSTIERETESLESAWSRGLAPPGCPAAEILEGAGPPLTETTAEAPCEAEPQFAQTPHQETAAAIAPEPVAAIRPAAAKRTGLRSRAPTYIRVAKPQPEAEAPVAQLEDLRGAI